MADLQKLKVAELKQLLKQQGLPSSGNKAELVERLQQAGNAADQLAEGTDPEPDPVEEEELNEDVLNEEDEEVVLAGTDDKPAEETEPAAETAEDGAEAAEKTEEPATDTSLAGVKILSRTLSEHEKQQQRAERFGIVSEEGKKAARAARFGLDPSKSEKPAAKSGAASAAVATEADLEKLKKRAERFGGSVSSVVSKEEDKAKLQKRAERFGSGSAEPAKTSAEEEKLLKRKQRFGAVASGTDSASADDIEAKKRKRAERFGLT